jgi:hypothetical protein
MSHSDSARSYPEWQDAAVQLFKGPIFEHEGERWRQVSLGQSQIDGYVRQIGLRLMFDTLEGYAYLDQLPAEELGSRPRLMKRRQLPMAVTIYGIFLRQELDRAIKDDPTTFRVRRSYQQIRELVAEFFPASNNDSADRRVAMGHLKDLTEMGFLRKTDDSDEFELTRLLRAKFTPDAAKDLLDRIRTHLKLQPNENHSTVHGGTADPAGDSDVDDTTA